jgi:hypothetical protein
VIFEKAIYTYWRVKNNRVDYEGWPESLKKDVFLEMAYKEDYEKELTFLY